MKIHLIYNLKMSLLYSRYVFMQNHFSQRVLLQVALQVFMVEGVQSQSCACIKM